MNFRRLFFLSFKSSKCTLLHRQMEFCWGGNKEKKKKTFFFKSQVIPGRVGGLHAPQRMIVCRGRVQKGDILDSHSLPSVIIQSTVIKISKLIFLQFQMFIWSCKYLFTKYWLKNQLEHGQTLNKRVKTLYPRPSCTTHIFCLKLNPFYWCLM